MVLLLAALLIQGLWFGASRRLIGRVLSSSRMTACSVGLEPCSRSASERPYSAYKDGYFACC